MEFRIKEIREREHMTQEELAKGSGVSRQLISLLETGKLTVTKTDTLVRLSQQLGCKIQDLFLD